jgi:hypothetical protein
MCLMGTAICHSRVGLRQRRKSRLSASSTPPLMPLVILPPMLRLVTGGGGVGPQKGMRLALALVIHCSGVNRFGVTHFTFKELEEVAGEGRGCVRSESEHARKVEKKSESKKHESSITDCRVGLVMGRWSASIPITGLDGGFARY